MKESILHFFEQLSFVPKIENVKNFKKKNIFIIGGMGGSALPGELFFSSDRLLLGAVHRNYGLPALPEPVLKNCLCIAASYSGNTEETLDFFESARKRKLALVAVTTGGKLLDVAKKYKVPIIILPDNGIQPRMALGFFLVAFMKFAQKEKILQLFRRMGTTLKSSQYENEGRNIGNWLKDRIPVIYSSEKNRTVAYIWKIKMNETGKIPAFTHVFPELNHNEMNGFAREEKTFSLSKNFSFLFLLDPHDHPRIQKRMKITSDLLQERGLPTKTILMNGSIFWEQVFRSVLLADWAALHLAEYYGVPAEKVSMVEDLKKKLI